MHWVSVCISRSWEQWREGMNHGFFDKSTCLEGSRKAHPGPRCEGQPVGYRTVSSHLQTWSFGTRSSHSSMCKWSTASFHMLHLVWFAMFLCKSLRNSTLRTAWTAFFRESAMLRNLLPSSKAGPLCGSQRYCRHGWKRSPHFIQSVFLDLAPFVVWVLHQLSLYSHKQSSACDMASEVQTHDSKKLISHSTQNSTCPFNLT